MKTRSALFLLILSVSSFAFTLDVIDDISVAIRSGNPKNISKFFIDNIDLKVIEQEDVYSKQQAEMILKDFFTKHPVKSYTVAHKSEPKAGSQYVIGTLETSNGKFRTYFLIKAAGGQTLIQQFRIETENE
jgi:acetylglutamate synthase